MPQLPIRQPTHEYISPYIYIYYIQPGAGGATSSRLLLLQLMLLLVLLLIFVCRLQPTNNPDPGATPPCFRPVPYLHFNPNPGLLGAILPQL